MISRLVFSLRYGAYAFKYAWYNYAEERLSELKEEVEARNQEMSSAIGAILNESDRHFANSFTHNLEPGKKPDRRELERFLTIVDAMEDDAHKVWMVRNITDKCPIIVSMRVMSDWLRRHTSLVARIIKQPALTSE